MICYSWKQNIITLQSGIDLGQWINLGPGRFDTIFGLVKSGLEKIILKFHDALIEILWWSTYDKHCILTMK